MQDNIWGDDLEIQDPLADQNSDSPENSITENQNPKPKVDGNKNSNENPTEEVDEKEERNSVEIPLDEEELPNLLSNHDSNAVYSNSVIDCLLQSILKNYLNIKFFPTVLEEKSILSLEFSKVIENYIFIPLHTTYGKSKVNNHFTAIIIDKENKLIHYIDPAAQENIPKEVQNLREKLGESFEIKIYNIDLQANEKKEGEGEEKFEYLRHCGAWVIEIFSEFAEFFGNKIKSSELNIKLKPSVTNVKLLLQKIERNDISIIRKNHKEKLKHILEIKNNKIEGFSQKKLLNIFEQENLKIIKKNQNNIIEIGPYQQSYNIFSTLQPTSNENIYSFLTIKDLLNLTQTNKFFYHNKRLWKIAFRKLFCLNPPDYQHPRISLNEKMNSLKELMLKDKKSDIAIAKAKNIEECFVKILRFYIDDYKKIDQFMQDKKNFFQEEKFNFTAIIQLLGGNDKLKIHLEITLKKNNENEILYKPKMKQNFINKVHIVFTTEKLYSLKMEKPFRSSCFKISDENNDILNYKIINIFVKNQKLSNIFYEETSKIYEVNAKDGFIFFTDYSMFDMIEESDSALINFSNEEIEKIREIIKENFEFNLKFKVAYEEKESIENSYNKIKDERFDPKKTVFNSNEIKFLRRLLNNKNEKALNKKIVEKRIPTKYGLKFHICLPEYDELQYELGWKIVASHLIKNGVNHFKIVEYGKKMSSVKYQAGKDITIYADMNPDFTMKEWCEIISEITSALVEAKIGAGFKQQSDPNKSKHEHEITGSSYFSYRYETQPPTDYLEEMKIQIKNQPSPIEFQDKPVEISQPNSHLKLSNENDEKPEPEQENGDQFDNLLNLKQDVDVKEKSTENDTNYEDKNKKDDQKPGNCCSLN